MKLEEVKINGFSAQKVELKNQNAITAVANYSPEEFEQFVFEYLLFVKKDELLPERIYRVGSTGDKGVDVYLKRQSGEVYYYQCKHYNKSLPISVINGIIVKILYYSAKGKISCPSKIYIVGLNGVSTEVMEALCDITEFKSQMISKIDSILKSEKLGNEEETKEKLLNQIRSFDFKNLEFLPVEKLISEYYNSSCGKLRFDSETKFETVKAPDIDKEQLRFWEQISSLPCADKSIKDFLENESISDYYKTLCLLYTDRFYFGSEKNFEELIEDIYDAEKYNLICGCKTVEEVISVLENATHVNTSRSFLDRRLHIVGSAERQGACHYLVENGKGFWKK